VKGLPRFFKARAFVHRRSIAWLGSGRRWPAIAACAKLAGKRDLGRKPIMNWTTPTLVEICIGLEINGYLPAEF
jgi:coenzyme PQQ precursor peptide PqqA